MRLRQAVVRGAFVATVVVYVLYLTSSDPAAAAARSRSAPSSQNDAVILAREPDTHQPATPAVVAVEPAVPPTAAAAVAAEPGGVASPAPPVDAASPTPDPHPDTPTLEEVVPEPVAAPAPSPGPPAELPSEEEQAQAEDQMEQFEQVQQLLEAPEEPAEELQDDADDTASKQQQQQQLLLPRPTLPPLRPLRAMPPPKPPGYDYRLPRCSARDALRNVKAEFLEEGPTALFAFRNLYRRQQVFSTSAKAITIATQLTVDRLGSLVRMAKLWKGPISASIILCSNEDLALLSKQFSVVPELRSFVSAHVVVGAFELLPINTLRNLAISEVTSRWTFVADVDSSPSAPMIHMYDAVSSAEHSVPRPVSPATHTAFVMPAFKFFAHLNKLGADPLLDKFLQQWPVPKANIRELWRHGRIRPQAVKAVNATAVALPLWMSSRKAFPVEYRPRYEPVYVSSTAALKALPYDESLVGHGSNKWTHAFRMFAAGWRFVALPDTWVLETAVPSTEVFDPSDSYKAAIILREAAAASPVLQCDSPPCWWQQLADALQSGSRYQPPTTPYPMTVLDPLPTPPPPPPYTRCPATNALASDGHTVKPLPGRVFNMAVAMDYRVPAVQRLPAAQPDPTMSRPPKHQSLLPVVLDMLGGSLPDITLTTQLTPNRLPMLANLAAKWAGPLSAVMHVCSTQELREVTDFWEATPALREYVRLHVLVGRTVFIPINTLRNVAINGSATEWVFVVDVDAQVNAPSASARADLFEAVLDAVVDGYRPFRTAYAVPAYAWAGKEGMEVWQTAKAAGKDPDPTSKKELEALFDAGVLGQMHSKLRGYRIDFVQWFARTRSLPFEYLNKAEHYFIARKQDVIMFPEEFVGRGLNKVVHAYLMYWGGWEYRALSSSWVVDTPHGVQEGVRNSRHDPRNPEKLRQYLVDLFQRSGVSCPLGILCWWDAMARDWLLQVQNYERKLRLKGWALDGNYKIAKPKETAATTPTPTPKPPVTKPRAPKRLRSGW